VGSDTNNSETDVGGHNKKRNAQGVFFFVAGGTMSSETR